MAIGRCNVENMLTVGFEIGRLIGSDAESTRSWIDREQTCAITGANGVRDRLLIAVEIRSGEGVIEIKDERVGWQVFLDAEGLIGEEWWLIESCGEIFDRGKIEGYRVISCEVLNGVEIIILGWIVVRQYEALILTNRCRQIEDNSLISDKQ